MSVDQLILPDYIWADGHLPRWTLYVILPDYIWLYQRVISLERTELPWTLLKHIPRFAITPFTFETIQVPSFRLKDA
jgi:hypothetical protein